MPIEMTNVPISLDAMLPGNEGMLKREIAQACGVAASKILGFKLLRKSVDARKKSNVHFVVNVMIDVEGLRADDDDSTGFVGSNASKDFADPVDIIAGRLDLLRGVTAKPYKAPEPLMAPDLSALADAPGFIRPIVVGSGPAGLFCALYLAMAGLRPLVVERGQAVEGRMKSVDDFAAGGELNVNSNVQFGEGGAGTFSDGKLNTGTKSPHIRHVLEEFIEAGAPEGILIDAKPHIGTDLLPGIVRNIRKKIESFGGELAFDTQFMSFDAAGGAVSSVNLRNVRTGEEFVLPARTLVLAIGHSARDTFRMLDEVGMPMERKPFAVGVRIEHLQDDINRAQYGNAADHPALGPADYKLAVHNEDGRGVYTFCMCPGGTVVAAASEEGGVCVNGMSANARDGRNSNSALLAGIGPEDLPGDDVFAGMELQRKMEQAAYDAAFARTGVAYSVPAQTLGDFMSEMSSERCMPSTKVEPSYPRGVAWTDLRECLPPLVVDAFAEAIPALDRKLHGFADPQAVLTGVEARSSSPIRILRDKETLQSVSIQNIYPAGEGAGYAGGIMSAATDGIRVAEAICDALRKK